MKGFFGKILKIDLSRRKTEIESISNETYRRTFGGKGLALHLLLRDNPPGVDPLGPENRLIFAAGPTTGSPIWGSCRHGVFTKSPQTGFFSESYSGGTAAEPMARAGYDAVIVYGAAENPVWIEVGDESAQIHDAGPLWGLDTYATEDAVKAWIREHRPGAGKAGVVVIGPAGENQVVFSVIENDYWRSAGRTGVGAVMGAKMVKAVAFHGRSKRIFADPAALKVFAKSLSARSKEDAGVKAYKTLGTPMLVKMTNTAGAFPNRIILLFIPPLNSADISNNISSRLVMTSLSLLKSTPAKTEIKKVKTPAIRIIATILNKTPSFESADIKL